jgi:putative endonuclease
MSTEKGKQAEDAVCRYLERQNYQVLERNQRLGRGELDIIAFKDDILVFVEVKGHKQRDSSLLAMHPDKCDRFVSAANVWLGLHETYAQYQCRFDLVIVTPRKISLMPAHIEHLVDVIRL